MVAKSGKGWQLAPSLVALEAQVDAAAPGRNRASDGSVGDTAHAARKSDHNPSGGYVTAVDITNDPANGFDAGAFAEQLRVRRDPRIKYVIWNRRSFNSKSWHWLPYKGANPHDKHVHVSVVMNGGGLNDTSSWFEGAPSGGTQPADGGGGRRTLRVGMRGDDVKNWQQLLIGAGQLPAGEDDGIFGPATKEATQRYQENGGLEADGIVGRLTYEATDRLLAWLAGQ